MPTRREALVLGAGAAAAALLPPPAAATQPQTWEDLVAEFTEGAAPGEGGLTLTAPELAENGGAILVTAEAPGATDILIVATDNPSPKIGRFHFGEMAGQARISTRIRLGGSQDVLAIARFPDGNLTQARAWIEVTVGGCPS